MASPLRTSLSASLRTSARRTPRAFSTCAPRRAEADASPSSSSVHIESTPSTLDNLRNAPSKSDFLRRLDLDRIEEWQAGLWARLEAEMRNQPAIAAYAAATPGNAGNMTKLISFLAREPSLALAFNYASLILNTSYFLENLSTTGEQSIMEDFARFEAHVVGRAKGMVGSGALWLTRTGAGGSDPNAYDILPTYAAGTLLVRNDTARGRADSVAPYGPASRSSSVSVPGAGSGSGTSAARQLSNLSASARAEPLEMQITPIACLSLFEHAYLKGWGVWGREEYAAAWYRALDWTKLRTV